MSPLTWITADEPRLTRLDTRDPIVDALSVAAPLPAAADPTAWIARRLVAAASPEVALAVPRLKICVSDSITTLMGAKFRPFTWTVADPSCVTVLVASSPCAEADPVVAWLAVPVSHSPAAHIGTLLVVVDEDEPLFSVTCCACTTVMGLAAARLLPSVFVVDRAAPLTAFWMSRPTTVPSVAGAPLATGAASAAADGVVGTACASAAPEAAVADPAFWIATVFAALAVVEPVLAPATWTMAADRLPTTLTEFEPAAMADPVSAWT
ncbi:MAG: hypothetical protein NVSMB60_27830 [Mycobacterium sp.]